MGVVGASVQQGATGYEGVVAVMSCRGWWTAVDGGSGWWDATDVVRDWGVAEGVVVVMD